MIRPMSPLASRLAAAFALLLSAALIAVLTLRAFGVPIALGPLASATPIPAPSTSAGAEPSGSADPLAVIDGIFTDVADLRNLPAADIGQPDFIDATELATRLENEFDTNYTAEQQRQDEAVLRGLGLLTAEQDYRALQLELLSGQVIGYYDDTTQSMVIVGSADLGPPEQVVVAHEYTHALQDAAFDLTAFTDGPLGQDDVGMARLALVEGDATTVMVLWALQSLTPDQLAEVTGQPIPEAADVPDWMVSQLEFAYTSGSEFVSELYARGDFAAVDSAFGDPPSSTEQILHLDAYTAGEEPLAVDAPSGVAAALGTGWTDVDTATLGEAMIAIWLEAMGSEASDAQVAAAGWGGDALTAAVGPDGASGLAWSLSFDTPADAREFREAYAALDPTAILPGRLVEVSDSEVLLVQASTADFVSRLVAALG
jgi:hypothetical protein